MYEKEKRPAGLYDLRRGTPVMHVDCGGELVENVYRAQYSCNKCGRRWKTTVLHGFSREDWKIRFYVLASALNAHRLPDVLVWVSEGKRRHSKIVTNWEASEQGLERVKF